MFQTESSHSPALSAALTEGVKLGSSRGSAKSADAIESVSLDEPGENVDDTFGLLVGVVSFSASSNWPGSYLGFLQGVFS